VINTNLPPILHRFQVTVKFAPARGECLTLTLLLRVIPANIAISDVSLKTGFYGPYFLYVIRPEKLPNSVKLRRGYEVTQGHRFWYQSKAQIRLPISD